MPKNQGEGARQLSKLGLMAQTTVCSSGCPAGNSIPDNGCPTYQTYTINVSGVGTINSSFGLTQVCVYLTHTWRSDIDMYLVAPDGTRVELSTDNGSSGSDYGAGCSTGQMLCFDMSATTSITSWTDTDPATGVYQPEGCLSQVNNGQNADGTWTLEVCDDAGGDVGALEGWCLVFDNNPPPCPTCTGDDCASAIVLSGTSGSLAFDLNACTGDYDASCTSACGLDKVFQIDVPDGQCLRWWVSNDNFDVVGYTYINGCPGVGTEVTCSDNDAFVHTWTNNTGATQTVYIVVDVWGSSSCTNTGTGTLNWEITSPTSSFTPDFVANTFPYSQTGTTCGAGNDVPDGYNTCNTSYDGGEDYIYEIQITTSGNYQITAINTDGTGYIGWFLTDQVPTVSCGIITFPTCIASATSGSGDTATACVTLNAGTYYLLLDYFPSPTCSNFELTIEQVGSTFTPDFVVNTFPYSQTGTTCGAGDDVPDGANSCNSSYDAGEDYIYEIQISASGNYEITAVNTDGTGYIGWFLSDQTPTLSCNSITFPACIASATSGSDNIASECPYLNAGTYYLLLDYFPSPTCSNFELTITPVDVATSVCQMNYTITSIPYSDPPNGYLSGTSLKGTFDDPDDEYSNQWVPFPFSFCFDGNWYDSALLADNGYIIFPEPCVPDHASGSDAVPGGFSPWSHDPTVSWPCNSSSYCGPFNAIALIWRDMRLNGEGTDNTPNQNWDIRYEVVGTPPNRRFYIKFYEIPAYGSNCRENPAYNTTGYIMLEEGTNAIEIHILQSDSCLSWDDGLGIIGLHSINGQYAAVPPGYNNQPISISPPGVAWRFEPPAGCCSPLAFQHDILLTGDRLSDQQVLLKWMLSTSATSSIVRFIVTQIRPDGSVEVMATLPHSLGKDVYSYLATAPIHPSSDTYQVLGITSNQDTVRSNLLILQSTDKSTRNFHAYYDSQKDQVVLSVNCDCSVSVELLDLTGKVLYRTTQFAKKEQPLLLDASDLKKGLYFVRITDLSTADSHVTLIDMSK